MKARLYGVGVGPGAPDLLTLRAARVLSEADVIATPIGSAGGESRAGAIVRVAVGTRPGQEVLPLHFPMTRDREARRAALEAALQAIAERLAQGKTVAFVSEGDPLVYGSFIDVLRAAPRRFPGVPVEVVPGVSSITAAAAAARIPLVDGAQTLAVLPGREALADLPRAAAAFDTVAVLKAGPVLPEIAAVLRGANLGDRARSAVVVSEATTAQERVERGPGAMGAVKGYFSVVLLPGAGAPGAGEGAP